MTHTLDTPTTTRDTTTDTMRAAVVTEFGAPLQISDLELPTPGYGEALVKLETSGVCHTDLHAAHGDWPVKPQPPFVPGHEGYGTVVALGAGVDDLKVGDKVGNAWLWSACGSCEYCRTGWETLCEKQQNGGYSVDGSFGTYMLVNAAYAPRIPDGVDPLEIAPILCAGVTVYKGLKVTDTRPGQWVAISGIGGLGHIAVQYARAMGLRVVAIDVDDSKSPWPPAGAEVVVNARTLRRGRRGCRRPPAVYTACWSLPCTRRRSGRPSASPSRRHHRLQPACRPATSRRPFSTSCSRV
jgi:propanol-preferring alcohol dehydrogenase